MREKEPSTGIIFVRHGQTDFPTDRIYRDDVEDPALNEAGVAQAQYAARWLQGRSIAAIYASPSARTRMTAQEVAALEGIEVVTDERLRERRFGVWDGLYFDEIASRYPDEHQAWKRDPAGFTPANAETMSGLLQRTGAALADIRAAHAGKLIVVVTHVGPIRVCLAEALKIPLDWYRQLTVDYGSLTRVDYGRRQNNLVYMNISEKLFPAPI